MVNGFKTGCHLDWGRQNAVRKEKNLRCEYNRDTVVNWVGMNANIKIFFFSFFFLLLAYAIVKSFDYLAVLTCGLIQQYSNKSSHIGWHIRDRTFNIRILDMRTYIRRILYLPLYINVSLGEGRASHVTLIYTTTEPILYSRGNVYIKDTNTPSRNNSQTYPPFHSVP